MAVTCGHYGWCEAEVTVMTLAAWGGRAAGVGPWAERGGGDMSAGETQSS